MAPPNDAKTEPKTKPGPNPDTKKLLAYLKRGGVAETKLAILSAMIEEIPKITPAQLRAAMDKPVINPATKECANQWLAAQSTKEKQSNS